MATEVVTPPVPFEGQLEVKLFNRWTYDAQVNDISTHDYIGVQSTKHATHDIAALDAVYVLDAIVGLDLNDKETKKASHYIPSGGYRQFLNRRGLKGKRLGIVRNPFLNFRKGSALEQAFESHFHTLRRRGAVLVDGLEIANTNVILNPNISGEAIAVLAEFKLSLNAYLKELVSSPARSLADVIAFNQKFSDLEKIKEFGQDVFLASEATNGIGNTEKAALSSMRMLSVNGFVKLMKEKVVATEADSTFFRSSEEDRQSNPDPISHEAISLVEDWVREDVCFQDYSNSDWMTLEQQPVNAVNAS